MLPFPFVPQAASSGTSVTVNLGGTQVNTLIPDSGQGLYVSYATFVTPASMTSPSFGRCGVYFTSPDSTNPDWGCGLWPDLAVTGVVNTQNATSGSCPSNCVLLQSGTNFDATNWAYFGPGSLSILINNVVYYVNAIYSTSLLSLNSAPGTQTGVNYTVHLPNTTGPATCTASSTTVATTSIYNMLLPSGCGTPAPSTQYWIGAITQSNTQAFGRIGGNVPCPNTGQGSWSTATPLANFAAWPPATATVAGDQEDGCYAQIMEVNYTTTAAYTPIMTAISDCDSAGTTCLLDIPTVGSGMKALIWESTSSSGAPVLTPTDAASDTFTKVGVCTETTDPANWSSCLYLGTITAGTTRITCNYTALNNDGCSIILYQGGTTTADKNCYDTSTTASTPYTGCTTSTTTAASELWVSTNFNQLGYITGSGWNLPPFIVGGSWISLGTGNVNGTAVHPQGLMYQIVSSTGTCTPAGTTVPTGSNEIFTACVTLK